MAEMFLYRSAMAPRPLSICSVREDGVVDGVMVNEDWKEPPPEEYRKLNSEADAVASLGSNAIVVHEDPCSRQWRRFRLAFDGSKTEAGTSSGWVLRATSVLGGFKDQESDWSLLATGCAAQLAGGRPRC